MDHPAALPGVHPAPRLPERLPELGEHHSLVSGSRAGRGRTGVVLHQNAEEALQRAQQRAVDHDGLLPLIVGVHIHLRPTRTSCQDYHGYVVPVRGEAKITSGL